MEESEWWCLYVDDDGSVGDDGDSGGVGIYFLFKKKFLNGLQSIEGPYKVPQLVSSQAGARTEIPEFQTWVLSI